MKKIVYLSIIILCGSCCKELHFESHEKFWTNVYKKNDVLIFQSNKDKSSKDTIYILDKKTFVPTGDCNLLVSILDKEGCVIEYKYKHNGVESDRDLLVQHFKNEKGPSLPQLRVYGTNFGGRTLKDTAIVSAHFGNLSDCYTFHRKGAYNGWSEFKIKTFVWSKKLGLVLFEGLNGEKYELVAKISK